MVSGQYRGPYGAISDGSYMLSKGSSNYLDLFLQVMVRPKYTASTTIICKICPVLNWGLVPICSPWWSTYRLSARLWAV